MKNALSVEKRKRKTMFNKKTSVEKRKKAPKEAFYIRWKTQHPMKNAKKHPLKNATSVEKRKIKFVKEKNIR